MPLSLHFIAAFHHLVFPISVRNLLVILDHEPDFSEHYTLIEHDPAIAGHFPTYFHPVQHLLFSTHLLVVRIGCLTNTDPGLQGPTFGVHWAVWTNAACSSYTCWWHFKVWSFIILYVWQCCLFLSMLNLTFSLGLAVPVGEWPWIFREALMPCFRSS